jgi:hypothetical protein
MASARFFVFLLKVSAEGFLQEVDSLPMPSRMAELPTMLATWAQAHGELRRETTGRWLTWDADTTLQSPTPRLVEKRVTLADMDQEWTRQPSYSATLHEGFAGLYWLMYEPEADGPLHPPSSLRRKRPASMPLQQPTRKKSVHYV